MNITKNFTLEDLRCKCCGRIMATDEAIKALNTLQYAREIYGKPLKITCGYRCPAHNKETPKSSPNSNHMKGIAFDLRPIEESLDMNTMANIIGSFKKAGFKRMFYYKLSKFLHADCRNEKYFKYSEMEA